MSGDHNMNQKPVAWFHEEKYKTHFTTDPSEDMIGRYWQPLYTAPRQWVGLTDEDRYGLYRKAGLESYHLPSSEVQYKYDRCIESYARAIEAKLKEKNRDQ
jgi:hypothetical protein